MRDGSVVLEADGLGKSFGRRVILKAASFRARKATIVALMGRNGSGKTTMLRIAVGRLRPDYGRVLLHGKFLGRPTLAAMARRGLFYAAQDSALTALFTVRQHLQAVARIYRRGDHLDGVIEALALEDALERKPATLSGGERQRTSLALALLRDPGCLLMDEPFVGVAPRDRSSPTAWRRSGTGGAPW